MMVHAVQQENIRDASRSEHHLRSQGTSMSVAVCGFVVWTPVRFRFDDSAGDAETSYVGHENRTDTLLGDLEDWPAVKGTRERLFGAWAFAVRKSLVNGHWITDGQLSLVDSLGITND
jgi:hypothetical protein